MYWALLFLIPDLHRLEPKDWGTASSRVLEIVLYSQEQRLIPSLCKQYYNSGMLTRLQRHSYSEFHILGCCIPPGGFAKALAALPHAALCRAPEVKIPVWLLDQHWLPIFGNSSCCHKPHSTDGKELLLPDGSKSSGSDSEGSGWWAPLVAPWGPTAALTCTVVSEHS